MERKPLIYLLTLAFLILTASQSHALFGSKKKKDAKEMFEANKEWVEERFTWKSVHIPLRHKDCAGCHASPEKLSELLWPERQLCATCHDDVVNEMEKPKPGTHVHAALESADCTTCHDPHASKESHLLKEPTASLCVTCHDMTDAPLKNAHNGITQFKGSCLVCHKGHSSTKEKLLIDAKKHPPYEEKSCDACHESPSKTGELRLSADLSDTCLACHDGRDEEKSGETKPHLPKNDVQCADCHSGHLIHSKGMLKFESGKACQQCHTEIPDMNHPQHRHPSHLKGSKDPLREGAEFDCATCHDPHASTTAKKKLMRGDFQLKMCLECHPQ